ncbi:hypothetical protein HRI_001742000 [Hibiscus trionum]|uniref:RRM domain-containing protein n=1 Tax=Hibiscus trionum TaxID=183268 RepID=A0A9W7HPT1_HIBTR|nr:hypothetical protein HRI_001742000 [Hibiscus trionum]
MAWDTAGERRGVYRRGVYRSGEESRSSRAKVKRRLGQAVFINNVSKRIHHRTLGEAFSEYGTVLDVYIAYWNPSRQGKRTTFAFVRFNSWSGVRKAVDFGDRRILDGYRIRVFEERAKVSSKSQDAETSKTRKQPYVAFRDNRSYTDVVRGVRNSHRESLGNFRPTANRNAVVGEAATNRLGVVIVEDKQAREQYSNSTLLFVPKPTWRNLSFAGRIKPMYNAELVQDALKSEGLMVQVCPWFGLLSIIRCSNKETYSHCWKMRSELIRTWFDELECLEGFEGKRRVKTWLVMKEVSLQVWDEDFFRVVASRWGELVSIDKDTLEKNRFDCARLLICVQRLADIPDKFTVIVNGGKQIIKIGLEEYVEDRVFLDGQSPWDPAGELYGDLPVSPERAPSQVPREIFGDNNIVLENDKEESAPIFSFNRANNMSAALSSSSAAGLHDVPIVSEEGLIFVQPGPSLRTQANAELAAQDESVSNASSLQEVQIGVIDNSQLVGLSQPAIISVQTDLAQPLPYVDGVNPSFDKSTRKIRRKKKAVQQMSKGKKLACKKKIKKKSKQVSPSGVKTPKSRKRNHASLLSSEPGKPDEAVLTLELSKGLGVIFEATDEMVTSKFQDMEEEEAA